MTSVVRVTFAPMRDAATMVRAGSVGELAWIERGNAPAVAPVLPFALGDGLVLALTFDQALLAHRLAESSRVTLVLRDPRSTGSGFEPGAWRAVPRLQIDPSGQVYQEHLITQELRRYPPSRTLVDSPMLCRENWWYLPRLILHLDDVTALEPVPARRADHQDHLLVGVSDGIPAVATVRVERPTPDPEPVQMEQTGGEPLVSGPAVLFAQEASYPDLERWAGWSWHGALDVSEDQDRLVLDVATGPDHVGLPPAPGLRRRWRTHRDLERSCRRALAAHEARP